MDGWKGAASLVGRILLVLIFVQSGVGKIANFAGTAQYMAGHGMPMASFFLLGAIFLELAGSLSVILGYYARLGALLLIIFLIPTTLIFHTNFAEQGQMIHLMKNISMLGGCFLLLGEGPGRLSLDQRLRGKRKGQ